TLTAFWTRSQFFTYLSLAALASAVTAVMVLAGAPLLAYGLVYSVLALALLLLARAVQGTRLATFTRLPLLIVAHLAALGLFGFNAIGWLTVTLNGDILTGLGSAWLPLAGMLVGVLFYIATDFIWQWRLARWAAAFGFALLSVFLVVELRVAGQLSGAGLIVVAVAYLLVGFALE